MELARLQRRVHHAGAGFNGAEAAYDSDVAPHTTADEESRPMTFIEWVLERAAELVPRKPR